MEPGCCILHHGALLEMSRAGLAIKEQHAQDMRRMLNTTMELAAHEQAHIAHLPRLHATDNKPATGHAPA
eukprot:1013694-Pelagomonas_calceolata.AAC.10